MTRKLTHVACNCKSSNCILCLNKRITELENEYDVVKKERDIADWQVELLEKRAEQAEAENKRLREALENIKNRWVIQHQYEGIIDYIEQALQGEC